MERTNQYFVCAGRAAEEVAAIPTAYMSEKDLQRQIVKVIRLHGIEVLVHRMDRKTGATVGWPDITFCVNGQGYLWEIKTGAGRLSLEQERLMDKLSQPPDSWKVKVIRSVQEAIYELALIR